MNETKEALYYIPNMYYNSYVIDNVPYLYLRVEISSYITSHSQTMDFASMDIRNG